MQVGAADGCNFHFDKNVVAPEGGDFDFQDLRARRGLWLYDSKHCGRHEESYLMNSGPDTKRLILAPRATSGAFSGLFSSDLKTVTISRDASLVEKPTVCWTHCLLRTAPS